MPLQSSGAINLTEISAEFGGATPDSISEYYRNGGLVPDYPANAGIPEAGAISWSDFYDGDSTVPVDLDGDILVDITITPTRASVGYRINSSGAEQSYIGIAGSYSTINTWLNVGSASDYDCRLTVNSGDVPAGSAVGTWLGCGTTRAWTLTTTQVETFTNNCTIEIRHGTTMVVLASASVNPMTANEGEL